MHTQPNKHIGDLTAQAGKVYDFTEVTGYLYASGADTKTAFPTLTPVGGYLYASGADTKTAFPKLTTVGGYLYASGADSKTAFPNLTQTNNAKAVKDASDALKSALAVQNLILADGILAKVVSKKGPVMRVVVIGRNKVSYIVQRDGRTAHGATLAAARTDLLVKIGNRDTSAYKGWTVQTAAKLDDLIVAYRVITGACAQGVSFFLAENKMPDKMTVGEAIEKTKGRYGHDTFRAFFASK